MRSINKVIIIGNLTRDPVMKMTQSGQAVATFGVATNRQWTTRDNQRHDSTEFHEVVAWAKLAEIAEHSGAPLNTVRSRLRLAKEALRRRIEADANLLEMLEVSP